MTTRLGCVPFRLVSVRPFVLFLVSMALFLHWHHMYSSSRFPFVARKGTEKRSEDETRRTRGRTLPKPSQETLELQRYESRPTPTRNVHPTASLQRLLAQNGARRRQTRGKTASSLPREGSPSFVESFSSFLSCPFLLQTAPLARSPSFAIQRQRTSGSISKGTSPR